MNKGYPIILTGFISWGLFPLYWSLLGHVPAMEVLMHRVIWSVPVLLLLVIPVVVWRRDFFQVWIHREKLLLLLLTSVLISINWGVFIWAVAEHRVIEASMGYFLTPLLNVLAGLLVFKERLTRLQWLAVALAAAGVVVYMVQVAGFPWVAIILALSFSSYGVLRKKIKVSAVPGLLVETLLILPFSLVWIAYLHQSNSAWFLQQSDFTDLWLILGGLVTVVPLVFFTAGTRLLPMATVGILSYITPSLQFFSGVFFLGEPMSFNKLQAFGLIWMGLILFAWSLWRTAKLNKLINKADPSAKLVI